MIPPRAAGGAGFATDHPDNGCRLEKMRVSAFLMLSRSTSRFRIGRTKNPDNDLSGFCLFSILRITSREMLLYRFPFINGPNAATFRIGGHRRTSIARRPVLLGGFALACEAIADNAFLHFRR